MATKIQEAYLRSSMFGLEDALVSTTGMVVGIAAGVQDKSIILLASFVTITVEAISMGAGQYLSERTVHQLLKKEQIQSQEHNDNVFLGAIIMFISYILAGLIPVLPMILLPVPLPAIPASIIFAFAGLFTLGFIKGDIVGVKPLKSALEMLIIGGLATTLGMIVGYLFRTY